MRFLSVAEAWFGAPPSPTAKLWLYVRPEEWARTQFAVVNVDPVAWLYEKNGGALAQSFQRSDVAERVAVARYRPQAWVLARTTYLIVDATSGLPVDGSHRLAAMAMEGVRSALAIDLSLEAP
jgi:hypothetical protein